MNRNPATVPESREPAPAWTLPRAIVQGSRIFIGNVLPAQPDGSLVAERDICVQTHAVFQRLRDALRSAGAELADMVRINTYYVYDGPEEGATRYWEEMTAVRLQYLPDPGPVGTAVRVAGTACPSALIQLEVEALRPERRAARRRIMPLDSWNWSMPVPLSQGWREGDYLWVGGQVCADRQGRAQHLGDLQAQTATVLRYISNVLRDGGASADDLLHLRVCYLHDGDVVRAEQRLAAIMSGVDAALGRAAPAVTAFGVNLLYEGLLLEIDAAAAVGGERAGQPAARAGNRNWAAARQAARRGRHIHVSGQSAGAGQADDLAQQIRASYGQCLAVLQALGGAQAGVGRLSAFLAASAFGSVVEGDAGFAHRVLQQAYWPDGAGPALTISLVQGLPGDALVQIDAIADLNEGKADV